MSDPFLSQVCGFGCNFTINHWSMCQGQQLGIGQMTGLFSLLGSTFGGDNRTYFNLPDLRGRGPLGMGTPHNGREFRIGETGGTEGKTIEPDNLPPSTCHVEGDGIAVGDIAYLQASTGGPDTGDPNGAFHATFPAGFPAYASELGMPAKVFNAFTVPQLDVSVTGETSNLGEGKGLDNRSPYLAINWQICIDGLYPPRS